METQELSQPNNIGRLKKALIILLGMVMVSTILTGGYFVFSYKNNLKPSGRYKTLVDFKANSPEYQSALHDIKNGDSEKAMAELADLSKEYKSPSAEKNIVNLAYGQVGVNTDINSSSSQAGINKLKEIADSSEYSSTTRAFAIQSLELQIRRFKDDDFNKQVFSGTFERFLSEGNYLDARIKMLNYGMSLSRLAVLPLALAVNIINQSKMSDAEVQPMQINRLLDIAQTQSQNITSEAAYTTELAHYYHLRAEVIALCKYYNIKISETDYNQYYDKENALIKSHFALFRQASFNSLLDLQNKDIIHNNVMKIIQGDGFSKQDTYNFIVSIKNSLQQPEKSKYLSDALLTKTLMKNSPEFNNYVSKIVPGAINYASTTPKK